MNDTIERPAPEEREDREYISGLEKGFAVLELFSSATPQLTPMKAANLTRLPRATARRCLRTLERLGYLTFDGKNYALTSRVLRLGHAYFATTPLPKVVQPVLETLSDRTRESASMAILDGADVVFIARSSVGSSYMGAVGVGARIPAYSSATGRVLLADLSQDRLDQLLTESPPRKLTPKSLTNPDALREAIVEVRERGYAICDEELELGSRSIAVPIRDSSGATIAAMSLAIYAAKMSRDEMVDKLLPALEAGRLMLLSVL